jgi:hypothetical protein
MVEKNLEFVLHVVSTPMPLNWETPRGLLISTFLNHLRGDLAPIGHFFIEFPLPDEALATLHPKVASLISGGRRVMTGMSRKKMTVMESIRVVQGNHLGLGSFYYDFKGKLDSVDESLHEIEWAKKRGRYASIRVGINAEKASEMLDFLKDWIERGSFRHYSGGLKVDCGEGAGCAEFGMHFLAMALGVHAVNPDWMRSVRVPHSLIGGGFAGHDHKVGMIDLFKDGDRWAYGSEPHHVYSIPDPDLVFDWIRERSADRDLRLISGEIGWSTSEFVRKEFTVNYPFESQGSVQEQWARIVDRD